MEHVVFFPRPEGSPSFRRFASLEEAVRFVEHLRNVEGVAEVSVYALTPVPVSFRPYYRVEVSAAEASVGEPVPTTDLPAAAEPMPVGEPTLAAEPMPVGEATPGAEPMLADPGPEVPEQVNGKRSLGFFAR